MLLGTKTRIKERGSEGERKRGWRQLLLSKPAQAPEAARQTLIRVVLLFLVDVSIFKISSARGGEGGFQGALILLHQRGPEEPQKLTKIEGA